MERLGYVECAHCKKLTPTNAKYVGLYCPKCLYSKGLDPDEDLEKDFNDVFITCMGCHTHFIYQSDNGE